jgi:cellulose synthase/poly-beta-1,6-N-acetylglucosamine synthase-like glycosyltransferase
MIALLFKLLFAVIAAAVGYLYVLVLAAIRVPSTQPSQKPIYRFAIAIPAHNEEGVICQTVERLLQLDYPREMFDIHVVADHCSDNTATVARTAGAVVHERQEEPRGSKGAALRWLFQRVLGLQDSYKKSGDYDAIAIFDADTRVARDFLRLMDARLRQGAQVVQGQHRITNPEDGWFPALTWAMFLVDNRYQNLGRSNLGWSAKNMGDSICFRVEILRRLGWGEGLTEDYAFRQQLLLEGIKIQYEPCAIGYGEAPLDWQTAKAQRRRWLRGTYDASQNFASRLLSEVPRRRDHALLDGALQAYLPSYSTLTLLTLASWSFYWATGRLQGVRRDHRWPSLLFGALFLYPFWGLLMERAPLRAYVAMISGPVFIVWRTWLAVTARSQQNQVKWIRTPRKAV